MSFLADELLNNFLNITLLNNVQNAALKNIQNAY